MCKNWKKKRKQIKKLFFSFFVEEKVSEGEKSFNDKKYSYGMDFFYCK